MPDTEHTGSRIDDTRRDVHRRVSAITKEIETEEKGKMKAELCGDSTTGLECFYMSVTTSICTVLLCHNSSRKETKVSMKGMENTARRVCETLRAWVCVDCME